MRHRAASLVLAAVLASAANTAQAQWETLVGPGLNNLFANKTHKWTQDGVQREAHYEPKGMLTLVDDGDFAPVSWRLYSGKSMCLTDLVDTSDKECFEFQTDGAGKYRMNIRNNTNTHYEVEITEGIQRF